MWRERVTRVAALTIGAALLLTACSGNDDDGGGGDVTILETEYVDNGTSDSGNGGGGDGGGNGAAYVPGGGPDIVSVNGGEPVNPLVPSMTMDINGGRILDLVFDMLIYFDADGNPVNAVAESIETEDNQTWHITLRDDYVFSNGEPVTADSFALAWDLAARLSSGHVSSFFFERFQGFSYIEDSSLIEGGGITVEDDHHFTVHLTAPDSDFGLRIGHRAFAPLPVVAFEDLEAFGEHPIGNGPYVLAEWNHNQNALITPSETYVGPRQPENNGVDFVFYQTVASAYDALRNGQLDILTAIPDAEINTFMNALDNRGVNQPAALWEGIVIPATLEHFGQNREGNLRRQAISMAIDRSAITSEIFDDTRVPARDFTAPTLPGWSADQPGTEVLDYNPEEARERWEEANEINEWSGTFELAYNADGGHQAWVDMATASISDVLDIEAEGIPVADFATFRNTIALRAMHAGFRTGWRAAYPGANNFLSPQFRTGAGSNDAGYANPELDLFLAEALAAADDDARAEYFQQAQEVLLTELPAIPLWYTNTVAGWGPDVDNVVFGWNSDPLLWLVRKG